MNRRGGKTQPCTTGDARKRLEDARSFLDVARLAAGEQNDELSYSSVAASLAVLAGIASADAACCKALAKRSRGQNHHDAVSLLATVTAGGPKAAKSLRDLVALKDAAQYGFVDIGASQLKRAIRQAGDLVEFAESVVRG